jgi:2-oxoglutarate dehydrogenase E1 component
MGSGRTMQAAESLERFLAESFPSHKRFGIEGCDALVPGLHAIMQV